VRLIAGTVSFFCAVSLSFSISISAVAVLVQYSYARSYTLLGVTFLHVLVLLSRLGSRQVVVHDE
jgi:hypothetical protein